jgi:hypothetical protein
MNEMSLKPGWVDLPDAKAQESYSISDLVGGV